MTWFSANTVEEFRSLLENPNQDVNEIDDKGRTILFYSNSLVIINYLIKRGLNTNIVDNIGCNALFIQNNISILTYLVYNNYLDIFSLNNLGENVLFYHDDPEVFTFFLEKGVKITTPLVEKKPFYLRFFMDNGYDFENSNLNLNYFTEDQIIYLLNEGYDISKVPTEIRDSYLNRFPLSFSYESKERDLEWLKENFSLDILSEYFDNSKFIISYLSRNNFSFNYQYGVINLVVENPRIARIILKLHNSDDLFDIENLNYEEVSYFVPRITLLLLKEFYFLLKESKRVKELSNGQANINISSDIVNQTKLFFLQEMLFVEEIIDYLEITDEEFYYFSNSSSPSTSKEYFSSLTCQQFWNVFFEPRL